MIAPAGCQITGRWRIVEADIWGTEYLDLVEPAQITFDDKGRGEMAFGCVNATLEIEYARTIIFFEWTGFDEGDEMSGSGSAELDDSGLLEVELTFDSGDNAVLKARRE